MLKNYNFMLIILGAIPGAFLRWQLNSFLVSNLVGALVIGIIIGMKLSDSTNLILGFGFCGSLTTYSSWIMDFSNLLLNGAYLDALFSAISMICIGLVFTLIGHYIGKVFRYLMLIQ